MDGLKFIMSAKADEKGSLYAKLNAKNIAEELSKEGWKIDAGEIEMSEVIRKTGKYKLTLKLAGETASIEVEVNPI